MDTQSSQESSEGIINPPSESPEATIHLPEDENVSLAMNGPSAVDAEIKTPDDVLESLVNFSNVISGVITDLQKAISRNAQEIANLRGEVDKLKTTANSSDQQDNYRPTADALSHIDGMRADDEYDSLLEKMEARRAGLKNKLNQSQTLVEDEQKKTAVDNARTFLKDIARWNAASKLPHPLFQK